MRNGTAVRQFLGSALSTIRPINPRSFTNGSNVRRCPGCVMRQATVQHSRHYAQGAESSTEPVDLDVSAIEREAESWVSGVVLRPYQEQAIEACLTALENGTTRMGVSLPTGSGKTTLFMSLIPKIVETQEKRKKTLILVNAVELATQAENAARRLLGDQWSVEVEQGKNQATGLADVTIATFQTLLRGNRLEKFNPSSYGLVIVDEAHHSAAKSYLCILQHFNQDVKLPNSVEPIHRVDHGRKVPIIGFTATFKRDDQLALSAAYEKIVFHRETRTMLSEGWLSPAKFTSIHADLDLSSVPKGHAGDYKTAELSSKMDQPEINQLLIKTYRHLASRRRSTLIFCVDLSHVDGVVRTFRSAGIDARSVSSMSKPAYRRETIADFTKGAFPVLVNCEVLTEGTDIPVIDCVILARPTNSKNLLLQMVGRGLRLSPDTKKKDCHIIDISDNLSRGLAVNPTLLGLTQEALDEKNRERAQTNADGGASEASESAIAAGKESAKYNVRIVDERDPFGLEDHEPKFRAVAQMSHFAWTACGKERYVLDLMDDNDYLKIEPSDEDQDGKYTVTMHETPPQFWNTAAKGMKLPREIAHADELELAFAAGDAWLRNTKGHMTANIKFARNAPWRQKPASKKQLEMFVSLKGVTPEPYQGSILQLKAVQLMGRTVWRKSLTSGFIHGYLTALKRGGMSKKKEGMHRAERVEVKRQLREKREQPDLPLPAEV